MVVPRRLLRTVLVPLLLVLASTRLVGASDDSGLQRVGELLTGDARWVSVDKDRVAFGAGERVHLLRGAVSSEILLDRPITEAVVVKDRLYLNHGDSLSVLDIASPLARPTSVKPDPEFRGSLRLSRTARYLIVAEDGFGLRILTLMPPSGFRQSEHAHVFPTRPSQVGVFPIEGRLTAVAALGRHVYAAIEGRGIAIVDIDNPQRPGLVRYLPADGAIRALATNGERLYELGKNGLRVIDLSTEEALVIERVYPEVAGTSIHVTGRKIHIAGPDQGVVVFEDRSPLATTHVVTVGDFFFDPPSLTVAIGDTVEWIYVPVDPLIEHNVESCDGVADPIFCSNAGGTAVEGQFVLPFPMLPTALPFNVSHTFNIPGDNPYFCIVHVLDFEMAGVITTSGPPPAGVPNGTNGPPLLVDKLTPNGARLLLSWDTDACAGDNPNHHITWGLLSDFPEALGGLYGRAGGSPGPPPVGQCDIGAGELYSWLQNVPNPALLDPVNRLLWFVVQTSDNGSLEGSMGLDSLGQERNGPGPNGSSDWCESDKDVSNNCP